MAKIKNILGREILDSRGNPTVAVDLTLADGSLGQVAVPAGASTGKYEAIALPALTSIANINGEIARQIVGRDYDQTTLDQALIALDGAPDKSRLGANAILGISLAFAQALAKNQNKELFETIAGVRSPTSGSLEVGLRTPNFPIPMFNILNGGRHASDSTDIQEFMIVPIGAKSFAEALVWGQTVWQKLKEVLERKGFETELGDEGGFAPLLASNTEALDLIIEAIKQAGFEPGKQMALALDIAASELKSSDKYEFKKGLSLGLTSHQSFISAELIDIYEELINKYPIISIEDGLGEDDWAGWRDLTARLGQRINLVGDDLFVTSPARLREGIDKKVANAIIIKPNQIGTLTETLAVIKLAQLAGYKIIVSHRSGETLDTTIADLAAGVSADFIKAGAPSRPERLAKYNRLLEIEKKIKN